MSARTNPARQLSDGASVVCAMNLNRIVVTIVAMARRFFRYFAALVLLVYGFAKINGSQFTILDSELDKPMGQVSGFWLTWYYFGFSHVYGTFLALVQIVGALLLTFENTVLLGACILVPVLANIVLIDFCYGVDPGAALVAILLLCIMAGLIEPHWPRLVELFLPSGKSSQPARLVSSVAWAVRLGMIALAFAFTYWTANYNNRLPTRIDGIWDVVPPDSAALGATLPARVFFEYNRAYMVVFKTADGVYSTHHFELDGKRHAIGIWDTWLAKGGKIFEGMYTLSGADLTLQGAWRDAGNIVLRLRRHAR